MRFGLPSNIRACLFDLDGVLTPTAKVHAAAWKEMFDAYLLARAHAMGTPFVPFDVVRDYEWYVDGKPRADGTRSFLAARGIELPEGSPEDRSGAETVRGLGNQKNEIVLRKLREERLAPYEGSARYVKDVRTGGLLTAVVSSSKNCKSVLSSAGIAGLFDTVVDGVVAQEMKLAGKPAPDTYLAAARSIGISPKQAAVFEDALAGVEAGRAGGFGYVVGVDRLGQAEELRIRGADVVVADLAQLLGRGTHRRVGLRGNP
jgi:beta-phosphoglucomutase family hydrolase